MFEKDLVGEVANSMRVVIVGTGPAGLTAMRIAMEENHEVLLIDQGPHLEPDYSPRNISLKGIDRSTGGIGGTCNIWAGQLIPLSDRELSSGDYSHLFNAEEYRQQASQILKWFRIGKIQYSFLSFVSRFASNFENPRFSLVTRLLKLEYVFSRELAKYGEVLIHRKVKSLSFNGNNISHLQFSNGMEFEVSSDDIIILAAGTMGNTRIILESLSRNFDLNLGGSLADHPCGYVGTVFPKFKYGLFKKEVLRTILGDGLKLKYELLTKTSSGCFEIHPNKSNIRMRDIRTAYRELGFLEFMMLVCVRIINMIFYKATLLPYVIADSAQIWIQFEQVNNPNSKVDFQEGKFSYNWCLNKQDLDNLNGLIELLAHQMVLSGKRFDVQKIASVEELNSWAQQANHPSGTLANKLFVDDFGIVVGKNQVLITGGAVLPRASWVNPTLTIMTATAIGVRKMLNRNYQTLS